MSARSSPRSSSASSLVEEMSAAQFLSSLEQPAAAALQAAASQHPGKAISPLGRWHGLNMLALYGWAAPAMPCFKMHKSCVSTVRIHPCVDVGCKSKFESCRSNIIMFT